MYRRTDRLWVLLVAVVAGAVLALYTWHNRAKVAAIWHSPDPVLYDNGFTAADAAAAYDNARNEVVVQENTCSLRRPTKCLVGDALSCSMCSGVKATCMHFAEDQWFSEQDADGTRRSTRIPANDVRFEGYCVADDSQRQCNPHHGRRVYVAQANNGALTAICECFNRYIVKLTIGGDCTTPMVCDGKVKDINVPFAFLECDCGPGYIQSIVPADLSTFRVPTCVPLANGITSDLQPLVAKDTTAFKYADRSAFSQQVTSAFKVKEFVNPCTMCAITGEPVDGALFSPVSDNYRCICLSPDCVPIRYNQTHRLLKGATGADGVIKLRIWNVHTVVNPSGGTIEDANMFGSFSPQAPILSRLGVQSKPLYGEWNVNLTRHDFVTDKCPS